MSVIDWSIGLPKASLLLTKLIFNANEHLLWTTRPILHIIQDQLVLNVLNSWHIIAIIVTVRVSIPIALTIRATRQIKAGVVSFLGLARTGQRRAGWGQRGRTGVGGLLAARLGSVPWASPELHALLRLQKKVLREFERDFAHTANTVSQQPVGHVDIVSLACVLEDDEFAVDAAFGYADGTFGGSLGIQLLRELLHDCANQVFLWHRVVHLKMNLYKRNQDNFIS